MRTAPAPTQVTCLGFVFDPAAQAIIADLAPGGMALAFFEQPDTLPDDVLAQTDVLMTVGPVTDAMMAHAPRLRFIQKWGTGYEKIDTAAAERHGIPVAITAGANANTIAEHALMLMLAVLRRVVVADRAMRDGRWIADELRPHGRSLFGKTVGIVGFGNIGRALARLLAVFETRILYHDPKAPPADGTPDGPRPVALDELLGLSDIVTLHCPGGEETRDLIDRRAIARMKPGAVLINAARGSLVAELDLVQALREGRLSGAGLDVYAEEPLRPGSPLRALDNVVLTPHTAGMVMDDIGPMARHAFANVARFLGGEAIPAADLVVAPRRLRAPRRQPA